MKEMREQAIRQQGLGQLWYDAWLCRLVGYSIVLVVCGDGQVLSTV